MYTDFIIKYIVMLFGIFQKGILTTFRQVKKMEATSKYSILYPDFEGVEYKTLSETTRHDLALDMLCKAVTDNPKEEKLIMDAISDMTQDPRVAKYRQEVFCDILKSQDLRERMIELFDKFEFIRNYGVHYLKTDEKLGIWHLLRRMDELGDYIACVESMQACLNDNNVESEGLRGFKEYVEALYKDARFEEMKADISALKIHSSEVQSVTVGINVNERFEATSLGLISVNNKQFKKSGIVSNFADSIISKNGIQNGNEWDGSMNYHPVESGGGLENILSEIMKKKAQVSLVGRMALSGNKSFDTVANVADGDGIANSTFYLSGVANKMLDMLLRKLRDTLNKYADIVVLNISQIIPEFIYYIRFAEFIEKNIKKGYTFCVPTLIESDDEKMKARGFYNLKLAVSGLDKDSIVKNNLDFDNEHTVYILTGANRGGKTTVTQAVGIMYVLAQGGISVPAEAFAYSPLDCIYTHFPADEDKTFDLGRLGEECIRFKEIYTDCTNHSLCLLNETFSTTSFEESYYIAKDSVKALLKKSVRTIYNTHMHKLGEDTDEINSEDTISKASSLIVKSDDGKRSFKVEAAPPEGKSYAMDIAKKYGVTYEMLTKGC